MEFNQSFTAPSIPKLSKRTISSPFGKKSAIQKLALKKTSFSFIKKSSLAETTEKTKDIFKPLETVKGDSLITDALIETNQSLVEIKNQLEKFFALNIAEEKEAVKKFKSDKARKRFALKESVVESAKKIGSGLFKQIDQVLAPTKSIFQKIMDFFGIILTGIVLNTALSWLSKPENQKKVSQIFEFLTKHWKWILGLLGGAYVLRLLYKVYKVGKLVFSIIRLIRGLFGKKLPAPPKSPGGVPSPKALSSGSTSRLNQSYSKFIEGKANIGDKVRLARRGFIKPNQILSKGGVEALQGTVKAPKPSTPKGNVGSAASKVKSPKGIPFPGWLGKTLRVVGLGFLIAELQQDWAKGDYKAIAVKLSAYGLGWATTALIASAGAGATATGVGAAPGIGLIASSMVAGSAVDYGVRAAFGYNDGGTVKGKDKKDRDSVPTLLTVGEEIVNKTSSMLFRPLIKDLNDNAGRLWDQFKQAVIQLTITNQQQKKISDVFGKVIEDFNKFLEEQIREAKLSSTGGGPQGGPITLKSPKQSTSQPPRKKSNKLNVGGPGAMQNIKSPPTPHISLYSPQQTTIKPVVKPSTASNVSQPIARARPSMVPFAFDLPAIKAPTPQLPSMPSQATEVPNISAVDMANPYVAFGITKKLYGIYVV